MTAQDKQGTHEQLLKNKKHPGNDTQYFCKFQAYVNF